MSDYIIETSDKATDKLLAASDATRIVIVGTTVEELTINVPENITPFYVLTMPDENVQIYLNRETLPKKLHNLLPDEWGWTSDFIASRLFYISPLYEKWRYSQTNPMFDARFIMWDEFGLPVSPNKYSQEEIISFLSQFNQCVRLVDALQQ